MRKLLAALALSWSGLACSSSPCTPTSGCAQGQACIVGDVCARRCDADGGAPCPVGTICQVKEGACSGTACQGIAVMVCL